MKKVLLAVVILVGLSTVANAQTKFGVSAGINFATATAQTGTTSYSSSARTSVNFGFSADFKGSDKFNIRSGLFYSGLGGKVDVGYLGGDQGNATIALDYVNIPLLARFKVSDGFYAYAGPQIGFLVNAKGTRDGESSADIKDSFKGTAFSGLIGAEYKINDQFGLGANYNVGFSNITSVSTSGSKFTTSAFSINLSYAF